MSFLKLQCQGFERCEKRNGYEAGDEAGKEWGGHRGFRGRFSHSTHHLSTGQLGSVTCNEGCRDRLCMFSAPPLQSLRIHTTSVRLHSTRYKCSRTEWEKAARGENSETASWKTALAAKNMNDINTGEKTHSTQRVKAWAKVWGWEQACWVQRMKETAMFYEGECACAWVRVSVAVSEWCMCVRRGEQRAISRTREGDSTLQRTWVVRQRSWGQYCRW